MSARDIVLSGGGSAAPVYVDDVFSTYLYTGNGATQTINNGIDLAGKGGMVWYKSRTSTSSLAHNLIDTTRGLDHLLFTNFNFADMSGFGTGTSGVLASFASSGYVLGSSGQMNATAESSVSWTFRKAPKFFDIVTYTGNATNPRTISHSLGSVPGMVIIKRTDTTGDWWVYHNGITVNQYLKLNTTDALATSASIWGTGPTSTGFTVNAGAINTAGATYVAYIYAHNAGGFGTSGNENVISCGSFTSSATGLNVNIGWEPQYLMYKRTNSIDGWHIADAYRGWQVDRNVGTVDLAANSSAAEAAYGITGPTATGVTHTNGTANDQYIYMAIRRPNKPPTSGTEVFYAGTGNGSATVPAYVTNFPVDAGITVLTRTGVSNKGFTARLLGNQIAYTELTAAYGTENDVAYDSSKGFMKGSWGGAGAYTGAFSWAFRRAPGFFDIVCYTGTGVATTVNHNLGVVPELMIIKSRNTATTNWSVYSQLTPTTYRYNILQGNSAGLVGRTYGLGGSPNFEELSAQPTSTVINLASSSESNASGRTFVTDLFATLAGISKVGSYTGNGTSQTIACGFTTGARFIMIKRTDSTGDWYVWDSARGIVSANDPHLSLNSTAAEVTTDDSVDPDNSGFIVNQVAATNINVTSATYIFLAIA